MQRDSETMEYLKSASFINDLPHFSVSLRSRWTFCEIRFIIFVFTFVFTFPRQCLAEFE